MSHTSRTEACHSGKSSRHWFAQSPLLNVVHESTHAGKYCNTQTIRDGPLAQWANTSSSPPKTEKTQDGDQQTTTTWQCYEQTTRRPCPTTSHAMMVTNKHTANISFTCVVAMPSIIVCLTMCPRQSLRKLTAQHNNTPLIKVMIQEATSANSCQILVHRRVTTSRNRPRLHLMHNAANSQTSVVMHSPRAW